jgi:molecular chaperone GrpE
MNEEFAEKAEDLTPESKGAAAPGQAGLEADAAEFQDVEEQLSSLESKLADMNDQYLRKAADFENFRKRMNREKQEAIDFANQTLLLDLIPIIDDFERAIHAAELILTKGKAQGAAQGAVQGGEVSQDFTNLYEGISMTEKRLMTQLENKWGLKRFDSAGEIFDPNRHEAIMVDKAADISEPTVQEDFLKGYTLKDRVVRSAKVKVLMPDAPSANPRSDGAPSPGAGQAGGKDTETKGKEELK